MAALEIRSNIECERLLGECQIGIEKIVDEQGLSLLHHAVLNGASNKVAFLLDWAKRQ